MKVYLFVLLNILLYVGIIALLKPVLRRRTVGKKNVRIACLLILAFCLFAYWGGDYIHYREIIHEYVKGGYTHMEPFYRSICDLVGDRYLLFRLIVWGLALILLLKTFSSNLYIDFSLQLLIFSMLYLPYFSYARASLAMASLFYGCVLFQRSTDKRSVILFLISFAFIIGSFFFHKTALLGIVIVLVSLIPFRINKLTLTVLLLSYPVVLFIIKQVFGEIMLMDGFSDDSLLDIHAAQSYINDVGEGGQGGIGANIEILLKRVCSFLVVFLFVISCWTDRFKGFPTTIQVFGKCLFMFLVVAFAFAFNSEIASSTFSTRIMYYSYIPSAIFVAYCYTINYKKKLCKAIMYIGVIAVMYSLLYSLYVNYVLGAVA